MTQLKILHLLKKREQQKLEQIAKQLFGLQQLLDKEKNHIQQLTDYSKEYQRMLAEKLNEGIGRELITHYYNFIQYLDRVIENQEHTIQKILFKKEVLTKAWQQQFVKNKSLEAVLVQKKQEEVKELEKKINKRQEDVVSSRYRSPSK